MDDVGVFIAGFIFAFVVSGLAAFFFLVLPQDKDEHKTRVIDALRYPINDHTPLSPHIQQFYESVTRYFEIDPQDIQSVVIRYPEKTGPVLVVNLYLPTSVNLHDSPETFQSFGQAQAKIKRNRRRHG